MINLGNIPLFIAKFLFLSSANDLEILVGCVYLKWEKKTNKTHGHINDGYFLKDASDDTIC